MDAKRGEAGRDAGIEATTADGARHRLAAEGGIRQLDRLFREAPRVRSTMEPFRRPAATAPSRHFPETADGGAARGADRTARQLQHVFPSMRIRRVDRHHRPADGSFAPENALRRPDMAGHDVA